MHKYNPIILLAAIKDWLTDTTPFEHAAFAAAIYFVIGFLTGDFSNGMWCAIGWYSGQEVRDQTNLFLRERRKAGEPASYRTASFYVPLRVIKSADWIFPIVTVIAFKLFI